MESRLQRGEVRTSPPQAACNSIQNADNAYAGRHLVRVTHPFHPLGGQQLVCVGERHNAVGARVLLATGNDRIYSVPIEWTDLAAPNSQQILGENRVVVRIHELLELERLVTGLLKRKRQEK
jgi:hypothetical protein